jgi:transcriptional regulator with PAS, ATPase and Fis domain
LVVAVTTQVGAALLMERKVLLTWIGHADLWGMAEALGGDSARLVYEKVGPDRRAKGVTGNEPGPIKTLVDALEFREVNLMSNYAPELGEAYCRWLKCPAKVHRVDIGNPANYREVFVAARDVFEEVHKSLGDHDQLCVHLSPGTPTMAAVSVLLAKTRFPATLYQTFQGSVQEEELPFDIAVDFIPELLKDTDRNLQSLASRIPGEVDGFESIIGQSRPISLAVGRAERAAIRDINVLLLGESGTGKEVFARAIHRASHRGKDDPYFKKFVALNCAAIADHLFESELFGHIKGAFTGADRDKAGKIEAAHGGTLFLDEVGECSLENQAKLLRALQPRRDDPPCQRWVCRVGETEEKPFNVRIIAATNRPLLESVSSRDFRDDLYYRLATVVVELPPLRERRTDIEVLAKEILSRINREFARTEPGYQDKSLTAPALRKLREHSWPGNVRELTNVLYQSAVMQTASSIGRGDVEAAIPNSEAGASNGPFSRQRGESFTLKARLDAIERILVEDAIEDADGNQTKAASYLGISQQALNKKLRKWQAE